MFDSFISLAGALLALGFLIFIHELGHYFMAKRVGMEVEAFGIGFGRPILSWKRGGTDWRLGWLPFGVYVKIKGMELNKGVDPYTIPNGFFTYSPWKRIKVLLAGPGVNILFAFLAFSAIWLLGGRVRESSEFSNKIGWIDRNSELFAQGFRPGDELLSYGGRPFQEKKDHLLAALTAGDVLEVEGQKIDYVQGSKTPLHAEIKPYPHPLYQSHDLLTTGVLASGGWVIYDPVDASGLSRKIPTSGPHSSGIKKGDRIIWVDGELLFSHLELKELLNDQRVLLTVKRGDDTLLRRVPRVPVKELRLTPSMREEIADWQHESGMTEKALTDFYDIPYDLTFEGVVEGTIPFIDREEEKRDFPSELLSDRELPLEPGDRIIGVQGIPVNRAYEIFYQLQNKKVNVIVYRDSAHGATLSIQEAKNRFDTILKGEALQTISQSIGTGQTIRQKGSFVLLNPITPKIRLELFDNPSDRAEYLSQVQLQKKRINEMQSEQERERFLVLLKAQENEKILGFMGVRDDQVRFNPNPFVLMGESIEEMWMTLKSLFTGSLSPKWLSGPVGIVQMVQKSAQVSLMELLYWLGLISLNLGILNLLPIPVLDGGHIALFFLEWLTGKKIKPKALERLIIPFFILLVAFFLFVTFYDLSRLLGF